MSISFSPARIVYSAFIISCCWVQLKWFVLTWLIVPAWKIGVFTEDHRRIRYLTLYIFRFLTIITAPIFFIIDGLSSLFRTRQRWRSFRRTCRPRSVCSRRWMRTTACAAVTWRTTRPCSPWGKLRFQRLGECWKIVQILMIYYSYFVIFRMWSQNLKILLRPLGY